MLSQVEHCSSHSTITWSLLLLARHCGDAKVTRGHEDGCNTRVQKMQTTSTECCLQWLKAKGRDQNFLRPTEKNQKRKNLKIKQKDEKGDGRHTNENNREKRWVVWEPRITTGTFHLQMQGGDRDSNSLETTSGREAEGMCPMAFFLSEQSEDLGT